MTTQALATLPVLTAHNRCDRCGGRAYVRATLVNGFDLHFCAHHGRKAMPGLLELGANILDESRFLTPSP